MTTRYSAYVAGLDEWPDVLRIHSALQGDPMGSPYIYGSIEQLKGYFINSLANPNALAMILLRDNLHKEIIGLMTIMMHSSPQPSQLGMELLHMGFVHSVYVRSSFRISPQSVIPKIHVRPEAGFVLQEAGEEWCKARGAKGIFGNMRIDGPIKGLEEKYGMKPRHIVVQKYFDKDP